MKRRAFLMTTAASLALPRLAAAQAPSPTTAAFSVSGLQHDIEIIDDRWGIPHIRAKTLPDAFFGQGYVTARDRLWQIDEKRRRALGTLAAVMGEAFLPYDIAARHFLYRGDIQAEWAHYGDQVKAAAAGYVAGVNAYVQLTRDHPHLLPVEFGALGYLPDFWSLDDLIRIRASPAGNVAAKVRRAQLAALHALDYDQLVQPLEPAWTTKVPEGLDVGAVSPDDLKLFKLLTAPLPWSLHPGHAAQSVDEGGGKEAGSNAWVIAPQMSTTGRPILANDPHLAIGEPSVRHIVHLTAPGINVIGGADPGAPGVAQGHNDTIAFGRTNFHIDQEDLVVLKLNPDAADNYAYAGGWRKISVLTEDIEVKGRGPERLTLQFTPMGPIISRGPAADRAVVLQAVWMKPGSAKLLADIQVNLAHDWTSFRRALAFHTFPTNYHYADVTGNIGWQATGHAPIRPNQDGLLPVPGDGRYDWAGIRPLDDLPNELNPVRGWFASANQMNLPKDYPYRDRKLSFEWTAPFRYQRIAEVLDRPGKVSLSDSVALQHDVASIPARRLLPLLLKAPPQNPSVVQAQALLSAWDCRVTETSAAAAIFELVWWHIDRKLRQALIPDAVRPFTPEIWPTVRLDVLERPDARWAEAPEQARDALLAAALSDATAQLSGLLGADPAAWSWGRLHTVNIVPPYQSRLTASMQAVAKISGGHSGGDAYTVMARWWTSPEHTNVTGGASYSMVLDVGAWDNSLALNLPGQSGEPGSRRYADLYTGWLKGEPFPLLFSPERIDAVAESTTRLSPQS